MPSLFPGNDIPALRDNSPKTPPRLHSVSVETETHRNKPANSGLFARDKEIFGVAGMGGGGRTHDRTCLREILP